MTQMCVENQKHVLLIDIAMLTESLIKIKENPIARTGFYLKMANPKGFEIMSHANTGNAYYHENCWFMLGVPWSCEEPI